MADGQGNVDLGQSYRLGSCEIDPGTGDIRRDGQVTRVQPMAIEVLSYLATRPNQVIAREEIEEAVWHDRIVGYDSLTGLMFKLRKALGDDTREPSFIETIPKKGYRLLVAPEPLEAVPVGTAGALAPRPGRMMLAGVLAVALIVGGVFFMLRKPQAPAAAASNGQIALAIIPFEMSGPETARDYLASGITDDLSTSFTKDDRLLLIAPESTGHYLGAGMSDAEIASRLGVEYMLRGTVSAADEALRVNARLIHAPSGRQLWAESYSGGLGDMFDIEANLIRGVTAGLTGQQGDVDLHVHTDNPRAYRAFQLGRESFYLFVNKAANEQARVLFREALDLDPDFTMARVMLAWTYAFDGMNGWAKDEFEALAMAEQEVNRAIAADPAIPLSYFITGLVFRQRQEYVKAMVEAQKAIDLDPYFPNAHVLKATLLYYAGRPEESVEHLKRAMELNPHHPFNYEFHLGQAYFVMGDYASAISALNEGIDSNPANERLHVWLAASFAKAGQLDDAAWEVDQVMTLDPGFTIASVRDAFPFKYDEDQANFIEALKIAGFQ
jgi:DNA-binding winged helix-turn-helix (wHTH) protein/TolB-like protein/cytochrome c-type biogenesis protein CcmH/NrfG